MKIKLHATADRACGFMARITHITNSIAGILLFLLFQSPGELRGQTSAGSYAVNLAWDSSSSADVTGYRIHIGTTSGTYTASIVVGNVTTGTVSGLAEGVNYYFTVSAFNGSGLESGFSNAVSFMPGLHTSRLGTDANGATVLIVNGLIGSQYDIEASEDLKAWALIGSATMPESASLEFSDPDAGNYLRRFYRTRLRP